MKIDRITITGADDKVNKEDLFSLSKEFPFVEWGILFSKTKEGQYRYPTHEWIEDLMINRPKDINLSAHLCGQYPRDILQTGNYEIFKLLWFRFQRVQINFNFSNTEFIPKYLTLLVSMPLPVKFIFQYNKSNSKVIDVLMEDKYRFDVLFDSSGGRGAEIKEIKESFEHYYTGYSGGLNPDNIEEVCKQITSHPNTSSVFIDCESGVRTHDDHFDLNKVRKYLEVCSKYISR